MFVDICGNSSEWFLPRHCISAYATGDRRISAYHDGCTALRFRVFVFSSATSPEVSFNYQKLICCDFVEAD